MKLASLHAKQKCHHFAFSKPNPHFSIVNWPCLVQSELVTASPECPSDLSMPLPCCTSVNYHQSRLHKCDLPMSSPDQRCELTMAWPHHMCQLTMPSSDHMIWPCCELTMSCPDCTSNNCPCPVQTGHWAVLFLGNSYIVSLLTALTHHWIHRTKGK